MNTTFVCMWCPLLLERHSVSAVLNSTSCVIGNLKNTGKDDDFEGSSQNSWSSSIDFIKPLSISSEVCSGINVGVVIFLFLQPIAISLCIVQLQPHQRDVTTLLAAAVQACHDMVLLPYFSWYC